jgi:hypothetical protein
VEPRDVEFVFAGVLVWAVASFGLDLIEKADIERVF